MHFKGSWYKHFYLVHMKKLVYSQLPVCMTPTKS